MAGIRLRRTYRDHTMLLRVDRRVGSVRFGKVRPDSRTGTTCTTRRWGLGRVRIEFGAHLHREPAHPGRRVVPRHHAPDQLARASGHRAPGDRFHQRAEPEGRFTPSPFSPNAAAKCVAEPRQADPARDQRERPDCGHPTSGRVGRPAGRPCPSRASVRNSQLDRKSSSIIQHDLAYRKSRVE